MLLNPGGYAIQLRHLAAENGNGMGQVGHVSYRSNVMYILDVSACHL